VNPSKQLCAQPGYNTLKTNVHAVSGGYPQALFETMKKSKYHGIANVHAVSRRLGAGLSASVSVSCTRSLKGSVCAASEAELKIKSSHDCN